VAGSARRWARRLLGRESIVWWGTLRRTRPVSPYYGLERGAALDRIYIERFLAGHASEVRGRVLEVHDPRYTRAYGGGQVTSSDILDVDASNEEATVIADLAEPGSLPAGRFDCAIVTQTLQYVSSPVAAVENLWATLAPGGVVLITVPCTSRIDPDLAEVDRWRITPRGLELLLGRCAWDELEVRGFGNVLGSVAFLMGISGDELRRRELEGDDPDFPLVACARARKAPA
jgi:SAM-dependent methyltransferase